MKRLLTFCAFAVVASLALLPSLAATNLNSSRSNVYRMIWATDTGITRARGDAIRKELDKLGSTDEAKLKTWFANNFRKFGVDSTRVKAIEVFLQKTVACDAAASCSGRFLGADTGTARATTIKGSKSNSSERTREACYCYSGITQTVRPTPDAPIVIFLLTDVAQENDAFTLGRNLNSSKSN